VNGCGSVIPRAIVSRGSLPGYVNSARARAAVKRFSPADVPQGIPYEGITKVNRSLTASLRCWQYLDRVQRADGDYCLVGTNGSWGYFTDTHSLAPVIVYPDIIDGTSKG